MHEHLSYNLLGHVESPYTPGTLGRLSVPLIYQRRYDQKAHEGLDNQSGRSEQSAAVLVHRQFIKEIVASEQRHGEGIKERQGWR